MAAMLEARFDDLTGASPSFRLVGPVGVLEATRAGEVVAVLEAAEAAAGRGLWVAGFVSYEAAPGLDPALVVRARDPDDAFAALPLAWFAMFERAEETTLPVPRDEGVPGAPAGTWMPTTPRERFESSVDEIRELIAAGETYQVNHTMRLRSRVEGDPRGLYRDLCYAQRGAYSAYLDLGRYRVLSASPELFFERSGGSIVTRPMKGTAPRGRWPEEDRAAAEHLLASAKDRAENAMIVDLLRNDLGRISRAGSVTWADVFQVERYETVWQLTTTVSAELETGIGTRRDLPWPVPERIGHRCAEGPDDGDHPRSRGFASRDLLRRRRLPGAGGLRPARCPLQRGDPDGHGGHGLHDRRVRRGRRHHLGFRCGQASTRRPSRSPASSRRAAPGSSSWRRCASIPPRASATSTGTSSASPHPRSTSASVSTRSSVREAVEKTAASAPATTVRMRLSLRKDGTVRVAATPFTSDPDAVRVAIDDVAQDPSDVFLFHKTSRRDRYDEARRRHPDADDVLLVNDRR